MDTVAIQVAEALLKAGAFKISLSPLFTWTSGIKSPVYCDLRALNSDVSARRAIVDAFVTLPHIAEADYIAGTATAAITWAAWIAEKLGKPMVYVRSQAKEHGTKKRIEGLLPSGQHVALIEDLISTGGSSLSSVEALREESDAIVSRVYAISTYGMQVARDQFSNAGIDVYTITHYEVILSVARQQGLITTEEEEMIRTFRDDPKNWAEKQGLL